MQKQLAKNRENVFIGQDGLARCKICEAPVMFLLKQADRWLTCPCKCRKREEEKFDRIAELKQYSGLEGIYRKADFDSYVVSKENEAVHSSCLNFAIHFDKVEKQGYGMYLFGESTDEKELLGGMRRESSSGRGEADFVCKFRADSVGGQGSVHQAYI